MHVYFHIRDEWVRLNNETDYINGYTVSDFVETLSINGININSLSIVKILFNGHRYITSFSNLLIENP